MRLRRTGSLAVGIAFAAACSAGGGDRNLAVIAGGPGDDAGDGSASTPTPGWTDDDSGTEIDPIDSGKTDAPCGTIVQEAHPLMQAADIVFAVDTSGSMVEETFWVQQNINYFSGLIAASGIDVHVVMLAAYSPLPGFIPGICVPAPLGSGLCPPAGSDTNLPWFFHHPTAIVDSNDGLNVLIATFPDWKAMLRPEATKSIVIVTDDDAILPPYDDAAKFIQDFTALDPLLQKIVVVSDAGGACSSISSSLGVLPPGDAAPDAPDAAGDAVADANGSDGVADGSAADTGSDAALDGTPVDGAPDGSGGTSGAGGSSGSDAGPDAVVDASPDATCDAGPQKRNAPAWKMNGVYSFTQCPTAAAVGTVWRDIIHDTGGVEGNLCTQNFKPVFDDLAKAIITGSKPIECAWAIPPPPGSKTIDPNAVNVELTTTEAGKSTVYYVDGKKACDAKVGGWYYDDPEKPTRVILCGTTCDHAQRDAAAKMDVVFGCETERIPR